LVLINISIGSFGCKKNVVPVPVEEPPFPVETFNGSVNFDSTTYSISGECSSTTIKGALFLVMKNQGTSNVYPTVEIGIRPIPTKDTVYTLAANNEVVLITSGNSQDTYFSLSGGTMRISNFSDNKFTVTFSNLTLTNTESKKTGPISGSVTSH
jgi:hypothetical protein